MKAKRSSAEALKHCWYKRMFLARTDLMSKVKVKVTLEQATKAQRGGRGIALLFP
jgi:hypothetical protein